LRASELKEQGLGLIANLLSPEGWNRIGRKPAFSKESAPGIQSHFNFNCVLRNKPACVHVTPYVEIVHQEVEAVRRAITGKHYYTINSQMQTLMGDVGAHWRWMFADGKDLELIASRIVNDSLTYGNPFIERFKTLEDITSGLESLAKGKRTIMQQSLAICYCLLGMPDKAVAVLSDEIEAARSDPHDVAHERLQKYVDIFGLPISL